VSDDANAPDKRLAEHDGSGAGEPTGPEDADADADGDVDFADLSLPQRLFVAAVQNPTRGVVVTALFAFAFAFYIAFWLAFPRVAALFSAVGVVVAVVLAGVYYLFDRLLD
jgi:hypothetical protein